MNVEITKSFSTKTYPGPALVRRESSIVVREADQDRYQIQHNGDFTQLSVTEPNGCETGWFDLAVGPKGVRVESWAGGMAPSSNGTTDYQMDLKPEQYQWAGLTVAGSLIGLPLGLLADAPKA